MPIDLSNLAPLFARWELNPTEALYLGSDDPTPVGLAVGSERMRSGRLRATITLVENNSAVGRVVFGYNAGTGAYYSAGLGGYRLAYVIDEYKPGRGWKAVNAVGPQSNLSADRPYDVEVVVVGQSARILVNGVRVVEATLPYPLSDDQVGLFAWGAAPVRFTNVEVRANKPRAFVVMHFAEPYDSLYTEVIRRVAESVGLEAYRADDVYKPGMVLQDIITGLAESEVVIAEITPPNANVFYELGYAHALGKQTILLAERGRELPFDVRSYRVIFYDNTIRGKGGVEAALRQHLQNILGIEHDRAPE